MDHSFFEDLHRLGFFGHSSSSYLEHYGPFNAKGKLGAPRPALAQIDASKNFSFRVDGFFRLFVSAVKEMLQSAHAVEDIDRLRPGFSQQLKEILERYKSILKTILEIERDSRVAALKGRAICDGQAATPFDVSRLIAWYLWCANEVGQDEATKHLNEWLDAEEVQVLNTLWIHGIEMDEEILLSNGCRISSAKVLPDSFHKERALLFKFPGPGEPYTLPAVAITQPCSVRKVIPPNFVPSENDSYWITQKRLRDIAIVLNCISGVCCLPAFTSSYHFATTPLGPFGGFGGGSFLHDAAGIRKSKLTPQHAEQIDELVADFNRLSSKEQERFRSVLNRIGQSKLKNVPGDRILDIGIALEMLLLKDNSNKVQLSLTFCLRGAWLTSDTFKERSETFGLLKELYNHRCQVAHSGLLGNGEAAKVEAAVKSIPEYEALAESICRKLMKNPAISWDSLILGGPTNK